MNKPSAVLMDMASPATSMNSSLWSFALVVGLLTLVPGLDATLILRTAGLGCATAPGAWCWASRPAR